MRSGKLKERIKVLEAQVQRLQIAMCNGEHDYVIVSEYEVMIGKDISSFVHEQCSHCEHERDRRVY